MLIYNKNELERKTKGDGKCCLPESACTDTQHKSYLYWLRLYSKRPRICRPIRSLTGRRIFGPSIASYGSPTKSPSLSSSGPRRSVRRLARVPACVIVGRSTGESRGFCSLLYGYILGIRSNRKSVSRNFSSFALSSAPSSCLFLFLLSWIVGLLCVFILTLFSFIRDRTIFLLLCSSMSVEF